MRRRDFIRFLGGIIAWPPGFAIPAGMLGIANELIQ
jgi:hypothetical protein